MTSSGARAVPWHAVVQFHREIMRRAGSAFFALPVTESAAEHWSSLAGFEPGQLVGPWEIALEALESPHLQQEIRTGPGDAFIGGPCWFRWRSEGDKGRCLEWIPLICREVTVEGQDDRLRIVPAEGGWEICPLVFQFLEQRNVQTVAPLDEMLPDLLARAESKAAEDGHGLTRTLAEAFRLVAPELGEALLRARNDFPADRVEYVPSPWVLFGASAASSAKTQRMLRDYGQLERHLTASPQDIGGLALLESAPATTVREAPEVVPIVPLNDSQRSAVQATLARRPVTVISGSPDCGKSEMVLSMLLNAWASSTTVLLSSNNNQAMDALRERLKSFESDFEIAVRTGEQQSDNIDAALGRTIDLIAARRGESHYGGSMSARKQGQLTKKKQRLSEMLASQVPQRLSQEIEAALESHAAQRQALSALASQREELIGKLRALGVEDEPNGFDERVIAPLRKWRDGMAATNRLIKEDAQRDATLQRELTTARAERDAALAGCRIESQSDQAPSWLLAEPGFESFKQALTALSDKLQEPIEDHSADAAWEEAFDAWTSSEAAADWERKAREMAALIRPAGIALKEKVEEVSAAREALDSSERAVQQAVKSSSLDVRREDLDEWATCYAELCALPRAKLAFLSGSKSAELIQRLEKLEGRFRISFPVHLWSSIGSLNENGRSRLSPVIEKAREWMSAREDWNRLGATREEIEAETDALRRRLDALGTDSLAAEVKPAACAAIASKLNEKASVAASAAAAWSRRETRERLPGELAELTTQIRAAAAGTPIKERWMNGAGAQLIAALDSVADNPGVETITAVRSEVLGPAAADPVLENWRRAYQAEKERVAIAEELERIPPRTARISHWKSRRPASVPAKLDVTDVFNGDDSHPVWAFLKNCEEWSTGWAAYRDEDAPSLEQTANSQGAEAVRHLREAAQALPKSKERAWLEAFVSNTAVNEPWPVDTISEIATLWRPQRLRAAIERIDAQLERITFETVREKWLDRVAYDADVSRSLDALRDHYRHNHQRIEENGYAYFEQTLKAQPVWITSPASTESIPMQSGLFDLLVIDEATQCTLTNMLPLIYRAKRIVVIGDSEQSTLPESLGVETERNLAARFGVEEWKAFLGRAGSSIYMTAVGLLPRRQAEVFSLIAAEKETASRAQPLGDQS
jgi:hypothetical protein